MTKPALGRSLGNLLEGSRKNTGLAGSAVPTPDQLNLTSVTAGLGSLLKGCAAGVRDELPLGPAPTAETPNPSPNLNLFGTNIPSSAETPAPSQTESYVAPSAPPFSMGVIQLSLVAADVLLLGWAWMLVRNPWLSDFWMVLLCFVSVSLGAWLACLAVFLEPDQTGGNSGQTRKK